MAPYLLIDFGTTSTKSALVDLDTGIFSSLQRHPAIPNCAAPSGLYEIPLEAIHQRFAGICQGYWDQQGGRLGGILACSEMHGFALLDAAGQPLGNYVSWKDERSLQKLDGTDTFSLVSKQLAPRFRAITGMRPRPGFPLMNLAHLARSTPLPSGCQVVSLPCWLARVSGDGRAVAHPTMLAGMGFYDVGRRALSEELIDLVRGLGAPSCRLSEPAPEGSVAGYWHAGVTKVPIYVGVGDHQCAVLGAGNTPGQSVSINLGTGSQMAVIDRAVEQPEIETRPYYGQSRLSTITHIPAGRALAEFVGFLEEVATTGGDGRPDFWAQMASLEEEEVLHSGLRFDLSLFRSARNFREGGGIGRMEEGDLTLRHYLASLVRSFVEQYLELLPVFDPGHQMPCCVLSGGIARNVPVFGRLVEKLAGYQVLPATELDESLLGLRTLALIADGRTRTYQGAQQVFGRDLRVEGSGEA